MAYYKKMLAAWLADHLGADWLHMSAPSLPQGETKLVITTTIRFGDKYCRISKPYEYALMSETLDDLKSARDEFFLFNRNELPYEEGSSFEEEVKKHGL